MESLSAANKKYFFLGFILIYFGFKWLVGEEVEEFHPKHPTNRLVSPYLFTVTITDFMHTFGISKLRGSNYKGVNNFGHSLIELCISPVLLIVWIVRQEERKSGAG